MQSRSWPRPVDDGEPSKKEVIDLIAHEILGQDGWSTEEAALLMKLSRRDLTILHLLFLKAKASGTISTKSE